MIINHDSQIEDGLFDKILDAYNNRPDEIINLWLNSPGGLEDQTNAIIAFINRDPDRFHIVGYGDLSSCAFYLFFNTKCSKELLPNTTGMIHKAYYKGIPISIDLKMKHEFKTDIRWKQSLSEGKGKPARLKTIGLSKNELKEFKEGKDVYFLYPRMKEFLTKQKPKNGKTKVPKRISARSIFGNDGIIQVASRAGGTFSSL